MRKLWQETVELFPSHSVLWLPYILTELLATILWRSRGAAARELFEWLTTSRTVSVFGTMRTENLKYRDQFHAAVAYIPVGFGFGFFCICLFVLALVVTERLVHLILAGQEPHLMTALKTAGLRSRPILWFSMKSLLVYLVLMAIVSIPWAWGLWDTDHQPALFHSPILLLTAGLLFGASVALLLTPAAFRLLNGTKRGIVNSSARKQGVILAIAAVASSSVLGYFLPKLVAGMTLQTPAELTAVCIGIELLANSPYALFFIALSLLALREPEETETLQDVLA